MGGLKGQMDCSIQSTPALTWACTFGPCTGMVANSAKISNCVISQCSATTDPQKCRTAMCTNTALPNGPGLTVGVKTQNCAKGKVDCSAFTNATKKFKCVKDSCTTQFPTDETKRSNCLLTECALDATTAKACRTDVCASLTPVHKVRCNDNLMTCSAETGTALRNCRKHSCASLKTAGKTGLHVNCLLDQCDKEVATDRPACRASVCAETSGDAKTLFCDMNKHDCSVVSDTEKHSCVETNCRKQVGPPIADSKHQTNCVINECAAALPSAAAKLCRKALCGAATGKLLHSVDSTAWITAANGQSCENGNKIA